MKKTIIALFVLVLMSSLALAQGQGIHEPGTGLEDPELREAGQGTGQGLEDGAEPQLIQTRTETQTGEASGEQVRERNREELQTGLENALTKVQNENARQRLEQNIEKFQQQYQERMMRMEGVEIEEVDEETGAVKLKAQEPVKYFGFIKGMATKRFEMDSNGNVNERAPWYSFIYTEDTEE